MGISIFEWDLALGNLVVGAGLGTCVWDFDFGFGFWSWGLEFGPRSSEVGIRVGA